jgi:hypothetical protein
LNTLRSFSASSSRLNFSSRSALSLAEIASPGRVNVGFVGGLADFAGTNAGLLVDKVALGTRFFVVLGRDLAGELEKDSDGNVEDAEGSLAFKPSKMGFFGCLATKVGFALMLEAWLTLGLG